MRARTSCFQSLLTSPAAFRLGLVTAFVSAFFFLMAAWGLFVLLVVADPSGGPGAGQAGSVALVAIEVYRTGFVAAQLFFGTWLFPLGYLVITSRFLPRLLGVLLIMDGIAELVWFLQPFLLPAYPGIKTPGTFVSLLAEVGLVLWLLIRGEGRPAGGANGACRGSRRRLRHFPMTTVLAATQVTAAWRARF